MSNSTNLEQLRIDYETDGLRRATMSPDPISQFDQWMGEAIAAGISQPNAMVLATADPQARPSSRAVLLKGYDEQGFTFFTNLDSSKGQDLRANPSASLCFVWIDLHRQIRIDGPVEILGDGESDEYFRSRPRESQLASAASPQSRRLGDRAELETMVEVLSEEIGEGDVPRPQQWRGIRVRPLSVEFWQGRLHRLHDRFVYRRIDGSWSLERLAP